jgi:hypothetical protein
MFVINIRKFANTINIQETAAENVPSESPVIICYTEEGKLTQHEVLRRFNDNLKAIPYDWIRPLKNITSEWIIDLKQMKHTFEILKNTSYLKSKITIDPEFFQHKTFNNSIGREIVKTSSIKFSIYPNEVNSSSMVYDIAIESDLIDSLTNFKKDYPNPQKCCFLMMKFEDSNEQTKIVKLLKSEFSKRGLNLIRVDDKAYSDDLFVNIKTYMHGCSFGLALFERINSNYFNPNVSLEVGYMMALKKPILFLKDKNLDSLHSDLVGKLYYTFDVQNSKKSIPLILEKWLKEKEII